MDIFLNTALKNNWITDRLASTLVSLDIILEHAGINEIEADLDKLLNVDEVTIDPITLPIELMAIYKKYIKVYLEQKGFLVDPEVLAEASIFDLEEIVIGLHQLNGLPIDMVTTLDAMLTNKNDVDDIELIYNLVSTINPNIKFDLFFNLLDDVSPKFLERLETEINEVLRETNLDDNVTPTDVTDIDDTIISQSFSTLKTILDTLGNYTSETIVNMLTYDTFIIFYHRFGDRELNTIFKTLMLEELEFSDNFLKRLITLTLPIALALNIDKEEYEDRLVNFLNVKFGKFDNEALSNQVDEIYDLLVNKTNFNNLIQRFIEKTVKDEK